MAKKIIIIFLLATTSCANMSEKNKKIAIISTAAVVGGSAGLLTAPSGDNKANHFALWAGLSGAAAGLYLIHTKDKEDEYLSLVKENKVLKESIDRQSKTLLNHGEGLLGSKLPESVRGLVSPGGWKLYQIDRWVKDEANPNIFYHQNQLLEIEPPSISSN